jgi:hypothetical protein
MSSFAGAGGAGSAGLAGTNAVDPLLLSSFSDRGLELRDIDRETILVGDSKGEAGLLGSSTAQLSAQIFDE